MYAFLFSSTRHTFSVSASDLSLSLGFLWSSQVTTITGEHNYVDPLFLCARPGAIASILPSTPLTLQNGKERIGWELRRKQQPCQGTRQLRELWLVTYTYIYVADGGRCYLRTGIVERGIYIHGRARRVYLMECAGMRVGYLGSNSGSATYWLCDFRQVSSALLFSSIKGIL